MMPKEQNTNAQLSSNTRLAFLRSILYIVIGMLVFFIVFNVYHQNFSLAITDLILLIGSVVLIIKLKKIFSSKFINVFTISYTNLFIIGLIFTAFMQPLKEMVIFWCFAVLVLSYAINGAKIGFIIISIFSIIASITFSFKLPEFTYDISPTTWINTLTSYLFVWLTVHIYECNNHRITKELVKIATHDTLTGLKDRHQVYNVYRTHPNKMNSLVLLDIDGFSQINEQHGYLVGDEVLINVANILKQTKVSDIGQVFRIDGDEFAILLHYFVYNIATFIATVVRNEIAEYKTITKNDSIQVTVSIGIACIDSDGYNFDELLKKANSILRHAKDTERNKSIDNILIPTPKNNIISEVIF